MSPTQEDPPNAYMVTDDGDDFVPKNAKWLCNFGHRPYPYSKPCGEVNEDIYNKICSKCGNERGYGATAYVGETRSLRSNGEVGQCWMLWSNDDGVENWTYNYICD
ncbi:hypothetical protein FGADI_9097 [Fusarium gaditjirri]|uniref:Uncharacterized protein n=1 Tax=Fusarium gaditjirri TaxID=282569 RepID=A0A8H4T0P2_9HYPO|nr:hypothetical protein FGADI_9097 [Fusarium gaditjirri]